MALIGGQGRLDWLREKAGQDRYNNQEVEQERQWLGKKVEWGGIEGNNLIRAFQEVARWY